MRLTALTARYTPPDVGAGTNKTDYSYDLDQAPTRIDRPDGQSIHLAYDSAGRLQTLATPEGDSTYGYSATTGKLAAITAPGGIGLAYSHNGALLTQTQWTGPVAGRVGFGYDNDFRLASLSVNGANPITYAYDADSLPTTAGALTLARSAQNGLLTGTTLGSVTDTRTYDGYGAVTAYTAKYNTAPVYSYGLTYDNAGRIAQKAEAVQGASSTYAYAYDPAGRLSEVRKDGVLIASYGYDDNGNRIIFNGTAVASYDDQGRLLSYNGASYAYTANGELQGKTKNSQTTDYRYDVLGNIRQAILPVGTTIDYIIDGQNRRIGKKVNGVLAQGFLYQDGLRIVAELDGTGAVVSRFVYVGKANVPAYMVRGGVTYRLITDHLGSPRLIVNAANGTVMQRLDYDEWGRVLSDTNPGFQLFGFAGGLYDRDTGLVRFGARDYDPETGRWTAKDPILFGGGDANLYGYVLNDPVNLDDPRGLDVTVALYPGAMGFGHVGIGVNSPNTSGYYPNPSASAWAVATGQPVPGVMLLDTRTQSTSINIPTTPTQDKAIQNFIDNRKRNPGNYDINDNNCAITVQYALKAGGINTPPTILPEILMENLQNKYGEKK